MNNKHSINSTAFYNILSMFIVQGVSFFATSYFSRALGTKQYGKYYILMSWVILLSSIIDLGLTRSISVGIYKYKEDLSDFKHTVMFFTHLFSLLFLLFIFILIHCFYGFFSYSCGTYILIWFMSVLKIDMSFIQSCYIYEKKPKNNLMCAVFITFASIITSIMFINIIHEKYVGKIIGEIIPMAILITYIAIRNNKTKHRIKKEQFFFALSVGFPIIFHEISSNLLIQSDRIMMEKMGVDDSEIGIYGLFYSLSMVLGGVLSALNITWCPFYYDDLEKKDYKSLRKKTNNYTEVVTILTIVFLCLAREVGYLIGGKEFYKGADIIPILVSSVYFIYLYMFSINFELFYKKTKAIAIGSIGAATINILMNYFFIGRYEIYGAAIATTFSYFLLFIFHFIISKRFMKEYFYINILSFIPSIVLVTLSICGFYLFKKYVFFRWGLGFLIGGIEIYRIYKRKSIF